MNTLEKLGIGLLFVVLLVIWNQFPDWLQSHAIATAATKDAWQILGTYGDSFGVLNSLMSSLAFLGVVGTIYLQSKQISMLRHDQASTEVQSKQQIRIMALTAMLNSHNSQTDRFQDQMFHLLKDSSEAGNLQKGIWMLAFSEHSKKGQQLNAELEELLASTKL